MEISAFSEFFIIQLSVVFLFRSCRSEQTSKKRNECCTNEGNTTARHELLHSLGLSPGVVISITFKKVDCSPDAKTSSECDNDCLQ